MLRGFVIFTGGGAEPHPYGKRPGQPVGEGLCPSRNLLTLCPAKSYNIPNPAPPEPREKGHPPRKNVFLFF